MAPWPTGSAASPVLLTGLDRSMFCSAFWRRLSTSFEMLLAARVAARRIGAAGSRVLAVSIVRDCYSGRRMARVMSLSFIVFLAVPIIRTVLRAGDNAVPALALHLRRLRRCFAVGVIAWIWVQLKLPETMHPEDRTPISFAGTMRQQFQRSFMTNRISIGYTVAMTVLLGGLFGFINSAQQVFFDVFHAQKLFTTLFAMIALSIAAASLTNARLVERFGTRGSCRIPR